uniref:Uncharacterized protein n=1 Tax=Leersia perrieri TaxID=77586 RepID=A0A0D9XQJ9_9ORYZ
MSSREDQFIGKYERFKVLRLSYNQTKKHDGDGYDGTTPFSSIMSDDDSEDEYVGLSMCIFLPDVRGGLPAGT